MALVVTFASQRGGVGKSSLVRGLLTYMARRLGSRVAVVDMDIGQLTSAEWNFRRQTLEQSPPVAVHGVDKHGARDVGQALALAGDADVVIVDAPGRATQQTLELGRLSALLVMPVAGSRDDLVPSVELAAQLEAAGTPKARIAFVLQRIDSEAEARRAREVLTGLGYWVAPGFLANQPGYKQAMDDGLSMIETRYDSLNEKAEEVLEGLLRHLHAAGVPDAAATSHERKRSKAG